MLCHGRGSVCSLLGCATVRVGCFAGCASLMGGSVVVVCAVPQPGPSSAHWSLLLWVRRVLREGAGAQSSAHGSWVLGLWLDMQGVWCVRGSGTRVLSLLLGVGSDRSLGLSQRWCAGRYCCTVGVAGFEGERHCSSIVWYWVCWMSRMTPAQACFADFGSCSWPVGPRFAVGGVAGLPCAGAMGVAFEGLCGCCVHCVVEGLVVAVCTVLLSGGRLRARHGKALHLTMSPPLADCRS